MVIPILPAVYKAQVSSGSHISKRWAVVKTAAGELENVVLKREYNKYKVPEIISSPYIRMLYDIVSSFEMDVRHGGAVAKDPLQYRFCQGDGLVLQRDFTSHVTMHLPLPLRLMNMFKPNSALDIII